MKVRGLSFVDTELDHWNFGLRENMAKNRPRSVIKSPCLIIQLYIDRSEELFHSTSQSRTARRRIFHGIQLSRKPAKVMNRSRRLHRGNRSSRKIPMR